VARALDLIGERWTLLIVRDLLLGPRRYGDLLESLDGITTNLLAKRLREMLRSGVVEKRRAPPPAAGELYALTEEGRALEPVVMELGRWGGKLLQHPRRGDQRDIGWALLSMKRRYAGGLEAIVEIGAGDRRFELTFTMGRLRVEEKPSERATARVRSGDQERFFDIFFRGASLGALEQGGAIAISGERKTMLAALGALGVLPEASAPVDAGRDVS
jgi:DNA-binding HxlR family transcriptional regulator